MQRSARTTSLPFRKNSNPRASPLSLPILSPFLYMAQVDPPEPQEQMISPGDCRHDLPVGSFGSDSGFAGLARRRRLSKEDRTFRPAKRTSRGKCPLSETAKGNHRWRGLGLRVECLAVRWRKNPIWPRVVKRPVGCHLCVTRGEKGSQRTHRGLSLCTKVA